MSLRRPATAAGSRKATALPPIATNIRRPKSALAKPASATANENTDHESRPPSLRERTKKPAVSQNEGTNIQVVIRCRRRSEREIQDGSPVIVNTSGPRGQDITIETGSATSVLGVVTLAPTRTYPFDSVFGPEADQAMIYNDVVAPSLEQVLTGYNCTLFAYGQTGTGKTYTMQGDLTPSPLGGPSSNAGMIPRVLFKLFQYLEANVADYSVKISFVELYNEELRDLLAPEMPTPAGDAQPMSMGAGAGVATLKIFDDSSKRGVFIQGLEETPVKDATDAITLLTKGSQRRQIAATKFNDHSSRSHSVFSITVHLKETSSLGDDLLRVGKLNLVDLAGSENIGRSGAENKRAREAGMINQSLLTLGRVINALVDKSSHVPYRESKLTRLLQDSLGGRTKTCIIATVSPAKCNIEETVSTLEYALKAKSIHNKPEINQRLTKNALLKEYINEIERLKADLVAAREKNGIWVSQENWDEMSIKNEERDALLLESMREAAIIQSQLVAVREEFEQSMSLLHKRETELEETKAALQLTSSTLHLREEELTVVKEDLQEEVVVREAHQQSEIALNDIASQLRLAVEESMQEIQSLFEKIERQSKVSAAISKAISGDGKTLETNIFSMETQLKSYGGTQKSSNAKLRLTAEQFQATQIKNLQSYMSTVEGQFKQIIEFASHIQKGEMVSDDVMRKLQQAVTKAAQAMKGSFEVWCTELKGDCQSLCGEVQQTGLSNAEAVGNILTTMGDLLQSALRDAKGYLEQSHAVLNELAASSSDAVHSEIERLRTQNHMLTQLLHSERTQSVRAKDDLVQRISTLLGEFTDSRNRRLQEAISQLQQSTSDGQTIMDSLLSTQEEKVQIGMKRRIDWEASLEGYRTNSNSVLEGGSENLIAVTQSFGEGLSRIQLYMSDAISSQMNEMDSQAGNISTVCSKAFSDLKHVKRARSEATENLRSRQEEGYNTLRDGLSLLSNDISEDMSTIMHQASDIDVSTDGYCKSTMESLSIAHDTTQSIVQQGTKKVPATGSTPTKRTRQYPTQWRLTKPRDDLLREWKDGITDAPPLTPDLDTLQSSRTDKQAPAVQEISSESEASVEAGLQEADPIPQRSVATFTSSASSTHGGSTVYVHRTAGGFGKVTKIPVPEETMPLKERPSNFVSNRPRRNR